MTAQRRDKAQTKAKILSALQQIVAREGFQSLGINSLAKEAGVDKVLIYRYFGSMAGAIKALARDGGYWPSFNAQAGLSDAECLELPTSDVIKRTFRGFGRMLRERKAALEIMRWGLIANNELSETMAEEGEAWAKELMARFPKFAHVDGEAMAALICAGVSFLVLRSSIHPNYNNVDVRSETGWQRIETCIDQLVDVFTSSANGAEVQ